MYNFPQGRPASVSNINCQDEDGTPNTRFVDRHNGWGLTALHIAVFQGSVHTGVGKAILTQGGMRTDCIGWATRLYIERSCEITRLFLLPCL